MSYNQDTTAISIDLSDINKVHCFFHAGYMIAPLEECRYEWQPANNRGWAYVAVIKNMHYYICIVCLRISYRTNTLDMRGSADHNCVNNIHRDSQQCLENKVPKCMIILTDFICFWASALLFKPHGQNIRFALHFSRCM